MNADYIVDVGPGAGIHGGEIVCCGTPGDIMNCDESITGQYLSGKKQIEVPEKRRRGNGKKLNTTRALGADCKHLEIFIAKTKRQFGANRAITVGGSAHFVGGFQHFFDLLCREA